MKRTRRNFTVPESVRASHILVSGDQEMEKVREDLKGACPSRMRQRSIPSARRRSRAEIWANFSKGQMVKEFEDAAFAMKVGDVSAEPVKTQFGLHLIKLVEKKDASVRPWKR